MPKINTYNYVFPLLTGSPPTEDRKAAIVSTVDGSSFCLYENYFLTAAHVLKEILEYEWFGVGYIKDGTSDWTFANIVNYESFDDLDIALIEVDISNIKNLEKLNWHMETLDMGMDIIAVGYPYALETRLNLLSIRGFKGNIVSASRTALLTSHPRAYELDFQCPRGLSGAPLMRSKDFSVCRMIVGNSKSMMLVFSDKEVTREGKSEKIVERYESMSLGLAIEGTEILKIKSNLMSHDIGHLVSDY